jgi:hypothetical protein
MGRTAAVALLCAAAASPAAADPLPGRDLLKFSQRPLDNLTYPVGDPLSGFVDTTYWGHDEFSTAYDQSPPGTAPFYVGQFMADDFADLQTTPIVHVKWWGSYPVFNPDFPVDKFLITFETDVPADPSLPGSFSRPGVPLLSQVVQRGPLAPGSGTFTEVPYSPGGPPLNEAVFEYNAELNLGLDFPEQADTVYWLKIVALVDNTAGIPIVPGQPIPPGLTQWGWHNRDYTQQNLLASTAPAVVPGEHLAGFVPSTPGVRLYHFQDDAVTGPVTIDFAPQPQPGTFPRVDQDPLLMQPTKYIDLIDGPGVGPTGQAGIGQFSKDLSFELYAVVPEPSTIVLLLVGAILRPCFGEQRTSRSPGSHRVNRAAQDQ